jgi:hypothetical protein
VRRDKTGPKVVSKVRPIGPFQRVNYGRTHSRIVCCINLLAASCKPETSFPFSRVSVTLPRRSKIQTRVECCRSLGIFKHSLYIGFSVFSFTSFTYDTTLASVYTCESLPLNEIKRVCITRQVDQ